MVSTYATSTFTSFNLINRDIDKSIARTQSDPVVARETEYYKENISSIKTVEDFVGNYRIFNYAMKAFGLEDMAYAKAYMRKVLEGGVEDKDSFANRLNDDRFVNFAKTFNFATSGEATTSSTDVVQPVVDKYLRQTLEENAGNEDQGVRLALYFERAAPDVKSAYGILADSALTEVVKTVFNLPSEMSSADIELQRKMIDKVLDIEDLQDPEKLQKMIQRFTVMWDATNNVSTSPVLSLFQDTSLDVSMSILNLKYGG
ncbi:MAG: flagellar biosynthesis protein FlgF [Rhizobiales bacterium 17-65-6]|nr:MAG: flagellar biosynthesis protein FlgF [Rhizobiales bacterium 12-68-15]OYX90128.1 MAG: flagellar biosynthesis protein FlgF [Azorhizobium sp. 32-67-21]OYZ90235.1 MAG: flagellar biosynthesis protein FlgF [Rhizobiales bacterium 17-65-6]